MSQIPNSPGTPPPYVPPGYPPAKPPGDGKATAALVLGIIAIACTGIIPGIIGIILASQARKEGYTGSKATIGLVLSIVGIAMWLLILLPIIACTGCFFVLEELYWWHW